MLRLSASFGQLSTITGRSGAQADRTLRHPMLSTVDERTKPPARNPAQLGNGAIYLLPVCANES